MPFAFRHPAVRLHGALRFVIVSGCAVALIAAGRFLPL
jgi:hypothetical protein